MSNGLFVAWHGGDGSRWSPVGKLDRVDGLYRFVYTGGAVSAPGFQPFPEMPDLRGVYQSEELFPLFSNRLLARSRPEYDAYLTWGGFDPNDPPDPLAILGVTEGRRQTDSIEVFPCPAPDADGCFVTKFFLHGIQWMPEAAVKRIESLQVGERLIPMYDSFNRNDRRAVALRTDSDRDRFLIGYVPRYLAATLQRVCIDCPADEVSVSVERVNPSAPMQMRLLCRMTGCWPEQFVPCHDMQFQPLAPVASRSRETLSA